MIDDRCDDPQKPTKIKKIHSNPQQPTANIKSPQEPTATHINPNKNKINNPKQFKKITTGHYDPQQSKNNNDSLQLKTIYNNPQTISITTIDINHLKRIRQSLRQR